MHFVGILLLDSFSLIAQAPRPEPRQTAARGARVCTGPYLTSRYQTRSRRPSRSQFATIYMPLLPSRNRLVWPNNCGINSAVMPMRASQSRFRADPLVRSADAGRT
jgi:hypothetical protein